MRLFLLMGLVGCYSPTIHPGAPCGTGNACPGNLVCAADQTCQLPMGAMGIDAPLTSDGQLGDTSPGIDAAQLAPPNDLPGDAIDITNGGDFTADLTYAHDDAQRPSTGGSVCGAAGGLDVFYTVHLTDPQVYYFDTFNSDFDTVIRVLKGRSCVGGVAPNGTTCRNDECGGVQSQYATSLPAGDSCVIIDGYDGTQTGHTLHLHVELGLIDGSPAPINGSVTGNTANDSDHGDGTCAQHGDPDHGYFLTTCPGQTATVTATTCNATTAMTPWDTALWSRGPAGELACTDDDGANCTYGGGFSTISFTASDAHLWWILVDGGGSMTTGAYELDVSLQ